MCVPSKSGLLWGPTSMLLIPHAPSIDVPTRSSIARRGHIQTPLDWRRWRDGTTLAESIRLPHGFASSNRTCLNELAFRVRHRAKSPDCKGQTPRGLQRSHRCDRTGAVQGTRSRPHAQATRTRARAIRAAVAPLRERPHLLWAARLEVLSPVIRPAEFMALLDGTPFLTAH